VLLTNWVLDYTGLWIWLILYLKFGEDNVTFITMSCVGVVWKGGFVWNQFLQGIVKIEVQVGFCPDIPNVIDMCIRSTIRTRYEFEVTTKLKLIEHREINIIYNVWILHLFKKGWAPLVCLSLYKTYPGKDTLLWEFMVAVLWILYHKVSPPKILFITTYFSPL